MKISKILIIFVICLLLLVLTRDMILKSVIEVVSRNIIGAEVRLGGFKLGLIQQTVEITELKVFNPPGFERDLLVDMPKMVVAWDVKAFLSGKIHLRHLEAEVKELGLCQSKEGRMNVDALKISQKKSEQQKSANPDKPLRMQVDIFKLSIGRVVNKNDNVPGPPVIKVYEVNLQKTYTNLTSAEQLAALIVVEPLKAAGIQGLKVYAASLATGVAALPVAAALTLSAKDHVQDTINHPAAKVYNTCLAIFRTSGKIKKEDAAGAMLTGDLNGVSVTVKIRSVSDRECVVTISARKYLLPQPEVAGGFLYELKQTIR